TGIVASLQKNRHLKYNDRQTLSLFLKEAGIGIDQCVQFFRDHFSCSKEKFDKEYLYVLRHNYGLEGKRANYSCFSCQKIAHLKPGFGCPFLSNHEYTKMFLEEKNVVHDIEDLNFQINCAKTLSKILNSEIKFVSSPIDYLKKFSSNDEKES
ncbi:putative DNA primase large subunit, partial [Dictyocoela roeselum]